MKTIITLIVMAVAAPAFAESGAVVYDSLKSLEKSQGKAKKISAKEADKKQVEDCLECVSEQKKKQIENCAECVTLEKAESKVKKGN